MGETILGPIDYLAVEWPGRHVTGEGFRLLMDLVDREIVRVLDLLFIAKDADGKVSTVDVADVEHSDALDERLWGLSSGLLDQSDVDEVAATIEPGSLAGILLYTAVTAAWMPPAVWFVPVALGCTLFVASRTERLRSSRSARACC